MVVHVLTRGDLPHRRLVTEAQAVATPSVMRQESAEAILGEGSHHAGAMETGNEPGE